MPGRSGHPTSLDQDAPGLSPLGLVKKVGPGPGSSRPVGVRSRQRRSREPHKPHCWNGAKEAAEPDARPEPVVVQGRFARGL